MHRPAGVAVAPGKRTPVQPMAEFARAHRDPTASPYDVFYARVAARQVSDWLTTAPGVVLDASDGLACTTAIAAAAGHWVLRLVTPGVAAPRPAPRVSTVRADLQVLGWLRDESIDVAVADGDALAGCLATETTLAELARVLRPGGRLLLCVDSLVLGLARLAEQGRWAELADASQAEVLLVPTGDGRMRRCFWPEELTLCLQQAGLHVEWVRSRTVLGRAAVERAMHNDPRAMDELVATELAMAAGRVGEAAGNQLLASAYRPT